MNTIPTVGPDTAVAPRTGSGSPQTPSQQRADSAPTVISDSGAASADPGVLLKVTPPVLPRQGDTSISGQAGGLPSTESLAGGLAADATKAIGSSAEQADLAIAKRIADALASLPTDIQEAIKQSSSPAIAQLLRLAAMTSQGIREAPAHVMDSGRALGETPQAATQQLHQNLKQAGPFQLALLIRQALMPHDDGLVHGLQANQRGQQFASANLPSAMPQPAGSQAAAQAFFQALGMDSNLGSPSPFFETIPSRTVAVTRDAAPGGGNLTNGGQMALGLGEPALGAADPGAARGAPAHRGGIIQEADPMAGGAQLAATKQAEGTVLNQSQAIGQSATLQPQQLEQAFRDGLKILMDGRMIWQGQFTPGVPMAFERRDAWRAQRDAPGGMEKGSSFRLQLHLPSIGAVEIRAVGFGGQVAARVQVDAGPAATAMAQALPALQERLRERGLAGAQVAVETH